jgi:hypothetical protein
VNEEEWLTSTRSGWMLERAKRATALTPKARARKFRLLAALIVRSLPGVERADGVLRVVEAVEGQCDGAVTPDVVAALVRITARPPALNDEPGGWGQLLHHLVALDAYSAAYGVASAARWSDHPPQPGRYSDADPLVAHHAILIRDVFGNPFRPVAFDPAWRTSAAVGIAQTMYESRDFAVMPILADALEDAGCDSPDVLAHCRGDGPHVRGCWVVDLVLGKV